MNGSFISTKNVSIISFIEAYVSNHYHPSKFDAFNYYFIEFFSFQNEFCRWLTTVRMRNTLIGVSFHMGHLLPLEIIIRLFSIVNIFLISLELSLIILTVLMISLNYSQDFGVRCLYNYIFGTAIYYLIGEIKRNW